MERGTYNINPKGWRATWDRHADQRLLNGRGHVGETRLVVSTFEHMNFCEWHFKVSLLPSTLTTSSARPSSRKTASGTAANASLISTRWTSRRFQLARSSA